MASIYKSFDQKLPKLEVFGDQEDHRTHVSGNTTKECTPPRCSIHIPVSHWHQLASRLCLEPCRDDLENEHLPVVENLIGLKSEGDVVNASTLYLTNPVHVGYQAVYPKDYYLNELTKPRHDGTRSSRVDRAYFLGGPDNKQQPGNSTNIFAALEYKKSGTINRERFQSGIVTNYKAFEMAQEQSRYVDRDQNNVMILLKQAVHYAWRYKTPFIAICDYNTLLLFYMSKQDGNYGGPYTYMTIVKGADMRKAYLGFLLAARSHANKNQGWRLNQDEEDILIEAEEWWKNYQKSPVFKNPDRSGRNDNPTHDPPSSQGSDVPMTGVQRGRASQANNAGASRQSSTSTLPRDRSTSTLSSRSSSTASSASRTSGPPGQGKLNQNNSHAARTMRTANHPPQGIVAKAATTTSTGSVTKPTALVVDRTKGKSPAISHAIKPNTTATPVPKRVG